MLAATRRLKGTIVCGALIVAAVSMISCATEKPVSLVDDPDAKKENAIPWNKQEKWEQGSEMGGLANSDRAR